MVWLMQISENLYVRDNLKSDISNLITPTMNFDFPSLAILGLLKGYKVLHAIDICLSIDKMKSSH